MPLPLFSPITPFCPVFPILHADAICLYEKDGEKSFISSGLGRGGGCTGRSGWIRSVQAKVLQIEALLSFPCGVETFLLRTKQRVWERHYSMNGVIEFAARWCSVDFREFTRFLCFTFTLQYSYVFMSFQILFYANLVSLDSYLHFNSIPSSRSLCQQSVQQLGRGNPCCEALRTFAYSLHVIV